ncbi:MAG: hypothetical protein ACYDBB_25765 [Armatimonadota bacterium]
MSREGWPCPRCGETIDPETRECVRCSASGAREEPPPPVRVAAQLTVTGADVVLAETLQSSRTFTFSPVGLHTIIGVNIIAPILMLIVMPRFYMILIPLLVLGVIGNYVRFRDAVQVVTINPNSTVIIDTRVRRVEMTVRNLLYIRQVSSDFFLYTDRGKFNFYNLPFTPRPAEFDDFVATVQRLHSDFNMKKW